MPPRTIVKAVSSMAKFYLPIIFFLVFNLCIYAQDETASGGTSRASIGLGAEFNMNSRENFAGGAVLNFNFNIGSSFAVGINATASSNFLGIFVIEPAALFRWYILSKSHTGLFLQADAGAYLVFEDNEITPLFMGGLRAGFRLPLGEVFFIEPFGRMGYPFVFGVGAMAGVRFRKKAAESGVINDETFMIRR